MSATQRLIEAVEEVFRLSKLDYDGIDILVQRAAANQDVKEALAAAKEEQGKADHECPEWAKAGIASLDLGVESEEQAKVLTDEEIKRIAENRYPFDIGPDVTNGFDPTLDRSLPQMCRLRGFANGLRYARDNGYLAPAKGSGLTVEWVKNELCKLRGMEPFISDHEIVKVFQSVVYPVIEALEAHIAEKEGGNLRTTPWISVEQAKKVATEFFYWWYNQPGTNTTDGFDQWVAEGLLNKAIAPLPAPPDNTNKG